MRRGQCNYLYKATHTTAYNLREIHQPFDNVFLSGTLLITKKIPFMKHKTFRWMFFASLFMLSLNVYAQDHQHKAMNATPEERANKLTDWMKKNLQLNDNQVSQVQALNLKYAQQNESLKGGTDTKEQKMKTMKANETARDSELKGILTADQYKKWQAKKSETKDAMKEHMKEKHSTR